MKYLIIALVLMVSGCAAFTEKAQWSDADYGGKYQRLAYEAYDETHAKTGSLSSLPHDRKANKSCVDHTVIAAQKAKDRGIIYKVVLFKKHTDNFHSAVKIGNEVIDISSGELIPYADAIHKYGKLHGSYEIDPDKIKPLFLALNGTFK